MKNIQITFATGLLFIFLLGSNTSFGQKKCKFDYEETDAFSGKSKKGNTSVLVGGMGYETWLVGWNREGDNYYLGMLVTLKGEFNTAINPGDSIMFKLADGNLITVYAKEVSTPVVNITTATSTPIILSTYKCNYGVTKEQLELIAASITTHVRMNIADKPYQKELKEKKSVKLQNDVRCILL